MLTQSSDPASTTNLRTVTVAIQWQGVIDRFDAKSSSTAWGVQETKSFFSRNLGAAIVVKRARVVDLAFKMICRTRWSQAFSFSNMGERMRLGDVT